MTPAAGAGRAGIVVAGGRGQLGTHLVGARPGVVRAPGRADLDLTRPATIEAYLDRNPADTVINCAAHTDVDGAETDEAGARAVNVDGARALAEACRRRGVRLLHVSTDYVFSGAVPGGGDPAAAPALDPADDPAPATVYGRTKLEGERAVLASHPEATVLRTAWLYTGPDRDGLGIAGGDFVATMARLESERDEVTVVADQWGSPTYAPALAGAILAMLDLEEVGAVDTRGLVLHAAGDGRATWYDVARRTFELLGADPRRVRPCTTEEFPRPAPRPAFSVLSGTAWRQAGLAALPHWDESLTVALAHAPGR